MIERWDKLPPAPTMGAKGGSLPLLCDDLPVEWPLLAIVLFKFLDSSTAIPYSCKEGGYVYCCKFAGSISILALYSMDLKFCSVM